MKNKNSLKIIIPVLLISSSAFIIFQITNNPSQLISQKSNELENQSSKELTTHPTNFQKLIIQPTRCIGCGKCARIDSSHFEMSGNIAKVISSTNLNSQNLTIAINNCPVQAITLQ